MQSKPMESWVQIVFRSRGLSLTAEGVNPRSLSVLEKSSLENAFLKDERSIEFGY